MTQFNYFEADFQRILDEHYDGSLSELMWNDPDEFPLEGKLIKDQTVISHDSYGSEDSVLERIYFFPNYEIHIMFYGTRCSYQGEEWDGFREVKETTKSYTTWE